MFGRLTNFDVFLLEYDDERSGSFEPLAKAPDDKQIILGLVSSKTTTLESASDVTARIQEAAKYTGLERLGVSTQCGFSSTLPGANLTTEDVQRAEARAGRGGGEHGLVAGRAERAISPRLPMVLPVLNR